MTHLCGVHTYSFSFLPKTLKGNGSTNFCEDGIILPETHVIAGMYFGPFLPDKDISRKDLLTTEPFHAISLAGAVSTVSRTSACFLVCHGVYLLMYLYHFSSEP